MPFEVDDDPDDDERTHQLAVTDGLSSDATEVAVTGVVMTLTFESAISSSRSSREDDGYVDDLDPPEVSETIFDDSPAPTESEPDHEPAHRNLRRNLMKSRRKSNRSLWYWTMHPTKQVGDWRTSAVR